MKLIAAAALAVLAFFPVLAQEQAAPAGIASRETPVVRAVRAALPSVVNIGTQRLVSSSYSPWGDRDPFERLFRDFFAEQGESTTLSLGSGSIIDAEGLVITNYHVVSRASKIEIVLASGKSCGAKIMAYDEINDVALLRLSAETDSKFTPIRFAAPGSLFLGETVIAVGNPFGLGHSISCGVLSAIGRKATYQGEVIFSDILQTDAAINPGNSGGPLINIEGSMIGMSIAMHKEAQNISFAIPLARIEKILAKWLIPERFGDVSLGIVPGVGKDAAGNYAVAVEDVMEKSPAWEAGLRPGARITAFNGIRNPALMDVSSQLWKLRSGAKVRLETPEKTFDITVAGLKPMAGDEMALQRLGLGLQELTPQLAEAMDYPFDGGLVVDEIKNGIKDLARGDMLFFLGDKPVSSFEEIPRALQNYRFGDRIPAVFGTLVKKGKRHYILRKQVVLELK